MSNLVSIGVDIGGSHCSICFLSASTKKVIHSIDNGMTGQSPEELTLHVAREVKKIREIDNFDLACVGIGCPGQCLNGTLIAASNLPGWKNVKLASMFSTAFGDIPVFLMNDADAAIAAEVFSKPVEKILNASLITLGTGIGMSLVIHGSIYSGQHGLIEGGHSIFVRDGRLCGCGQRGCVEAYGSALSTARRMWELDRLLEELSQRTDIDVDPPSQPPGPSAPPLTDIHLHAIITPTSPLNSVDYVPPPPVSSQMRSPSSLADEIEESHVQTNSIVEAVGETTVDNPPTPTVPTTSTSTPMNLQLAAITAYQALNRAQVDAFVGRSAEHFRTHIHDARVVFDRAANGDPLALHILDETARSIAVLCINISRFLDPQLILLGGGMALAGPVLLDRVRAHIATLSWTVLPMSVDVRLVTSDHLGGARGAALAALRHFSIDNQ